MTLDENYQSIINYLYQTAPMFQHVGKSAYKTGLGTTLTLDAHFGHPHRCYRTIHVAGTNGKGSVSSLLASVLQKSGYRTGLYTSPHLVDFRERIRIDGRMIDKADVIHFVDTNKSLIERLKPSFFEITTAMAFCYFAEQKVDVAVIEVGLGGRLDCTNIITPELAVITNISLDHTDLLGDTLQKIASEKAGVIKPHVPVIVGETQPEIVSVFRSKAAQEQAPIVFADEVLGVPDLPCELTGIYQQRNKHTAYVAIEQLRQGGFNISEEAVIDGFAHVCTLSGLQGRWQQLSQHPDVYCDTGHNEGGFRYIVEQLRTRKCRQLRVVIGMVSDKKRDVILSLLPRTAVYYFTNANIPRALPGALLQAEAAAYGLRGGVYVSVREALQAARYDAAPDDFIFVGGSNFVVGEIL